ncbi:MAG: FemAB family PEP-CTERM system-associated protein [Chromatiaceae bacterium]|nr:FemAB family PEP-CTERM system-associated protein [Chromatiaceae bacterium]
MTSEPGLFIRAYREADRAAWEALVERHPEATFFHRIGWREVLEAAFGHRSHYLIAEHAGALRGLLPLAEVRSLLFGHALISTPFCVRGGALAESPQVREQLDAAACRLAESLGVDYLEMRLDAPGQPHWPRKDLYVGFRKPLDPDPERNLLAIPRKQRAMVRKGLAAGLVGVAEEGTDGVYALYAESQRNLGTPVVSRRYFRLLKAVFGEDCEALTVRHRGRPLAGVLSFRFRDQILPYYGGGGIKARRLHANDLMYWEVMRRACERGCRLFDFGRSKRGTGSFNFKRNWGFEPEPLSYEYHLVRARSVPDLSPLNPRYRLFIAGWKRLPLPLSRLLGPPLARALG